MEKKDFAGEIITWLYIAFFFGAALYSRFKKMRKTQSSNRESTIDSPQHPHFKPIKVDNKVADEPLKKPVDEMPDFMAEGISAIPSEPIVEEPVTAKPQAKRIRSHKRKALRQALVWNEILSPKFPLDSLTNTTIKN